MLKLFIIFALGSTTLTQQDRQAAAALSPKSAPTLSCTTSAAEGPLLACPTADELFWARIGGPGMGQVPAAPAAAAASSGVSFSTLLYAFVGVAAVAGVATSVGGSNSDSP